jgi:hypothetical protein
MDLQVQTNLTASAISDDGRWMVVSDMYESKLFRLEDVGFWQSFYETHTYSGSL